MLSSTKETHRDDKRLPFRTMLPLVTDSSELILTGAVRAATGITCSQLHFHLQRACVETRFPMVNQGNIDTFADHRYFQPPGPKPEGRHSGMHLEV
jgi:hypothetical protein